MAKTSNQLKLHLIAGARPNFMKVAPLFHALAKEPRFKTLLIHTGQHFDAEMSEVFFRDLMLPEPHVHLGIGGGTHAEQTARVMVAYEQVCLKERPDLTIVVGDVDSTMACTIAAKKLGIKVAHLESGLRSFDRAMPEELNRVVTDALADILWTPSPDGNANLAREGVDPSKVSRVGNIMIDSYEMLRSKIKTEDTCERMGLKSRAYGVVTLHRPSNVDDSEALGVLTDRLIEIAGLLPLVFPVHPRTKQRLETFGLMKKLESAGPALLLEKPLNYKSFMKLVEECRLVITDSGGIQEETTYLDIPCFTLRENTERPITVTQGTNVLVTPKNIVQHIKSTLAGENRKARKCPDLWDGKTAERIVQDLVARFFTAV